MSDRELVQASLQKPDYFAGLVDRYEAKLRRYIQRRTAANDQDIQDMLQDIFIKAYTNLNGFDDQLSFSSWIYRIAHNHSVSWYRKHRLRAEGRIYPDGDEDIFEHIASACDIEYEQWKGDMKKIMNQAIAELSDDYRDIIMLRFFEYKEYEDISDILEIPPGTVATRLNRAKKKLHTLLASHIA